MLDVTVAVATFGDDGWRTLAEERAIPSAERLGVPVVHAHARTLHDARNEALAMVGTEWVCHLDADDELEPGYFDAMADGACDLRAPAVRYVTVLGPDVQPKVPRVAGHDHDCTGECLDAGNWLVVGALARTELVRSVGGWRDWPIYEDWDLWLRCWRAGATVEAAPEAVYRAHVRPRSRNRGMPQAARMWWHQRIALGVA